MQYMIDYSKIFILLTFVNIFIIFNIDTNFSSLFIYLNSISLNLIMINDIYFQMKHKHINFEIMHTFYPSSRKYINALFKINFASIIFGTAYFCYEYWNIQFIDFIFINKSYEYIYKTPKREITLPELGLTINYYQKISSNQSSNFDI